MAEPELFSVVAPTDDISEKGLTRGQVGTIVEILAPGVYEVEFSDDRGQTYAYSSRAIPLPDETLSRAEARRRVA